MKESDKMLKYLQENGADKFNNKNRSIIMSLPIIKTKDTYMIKDADKHIISKVKYFDYSKKNFDWILMADIETDPDYRRMGLVSKLINALYTDVTKNSNNGLYLFVKTDNNIAIQTYQKLGFNSVRNYTLKDGKYIIMAKGNANKTQFDKMKFS